jgi:diguanylate cyclase (GGDEF)-like protein
MKAHVADHAVLSRTLTRRRGRRKDDAGLGETLAEVLSWANRFVPSMSGSILLDDPAMKGGPEGGGRLYFAACFGRNSARLVGSCLGQDQGIAGETYRTGRPYISADVDRDAKFHPEIDRKLNFRSRSIICAPITLHGSTIGVIELINKKGGNRYTGDDLALLEIFAGYTASFMENALAGREFLVLSRTDDLSRLYNDRYFMLRLEEEAQRAIRRGGDLGLIFFDLDGFKAVNDRHGHLAGSEVLREVGGVLLELFGGTEAVMARYGGDEYVVILPGEGLEGALAAAERLRGRIASNVFLERPGPRGVPALRLRGTITCSAGVASLRLSAAGRRDPGRAAEALIRAADSAMYMAKERGKNRAVPYPGRWR